MKIEENIFCIEEEAAKIVFSARKKSKEIAETYEKQGAEAEARINEKIDKKIEEIKCEYSIRLKSDLSTIEKQKAEVIGRITRITDSVSERQAAEILLELLKE